MAVQRWPPPANGIEARLDAILESLGLIRDLLEARLPRPVVHHHRAPEPDFDGMRAELLREVERLGPPLPEDFPGREALADAGITTYGEVPSAFGQLIAIPGIGKATARKILERAEAR